MESADDIQLSEKFLQDEDLKSLEDIAGSSMSLCRDGRPCVEAAAADRVDAIALRAADKHRAKAAAVWAHQRS